MKKVFLGLLAVTGSAFGGYDGPLLVKNTTPGFVMPQMRIFTTCKIYPNKVQVIRTIPGLRTEEVTKFNVKVEEILPLIEEAAKGKITSHTGPTDGPTENISAINPNGPAQVLLRATGDVNSTNEAPAATSLTLLVESVCK